MAGHSYAADLAVRAGLVFGGDLVDLVGLDVGVDLTFDLRLRSYLPTSPRRRLYPCLAKVPHMQGIKLTPCMPQERRSETAYVGAS